MSRPLQRTEATRRRDGAGVRWAGAADPWAQVRRAALAVAAVDLVGVASLSVFYVVGSPFGMVNDISNGALGILGAVLAWQVHRVATPSAGHGLALAAAVVGGAVMALGSVLVVWDLTGWYLAGLVTGVGAALLGAWLVVVSRGALRERASGGVSRLGTAAGVVMLLGLAGLPGVLAGVDDWEAASWYVNAGLLGWLGTYVLYPTWCLRVARHLRRQEHSAA